MASELLNRIKAAGTPATVGQVTLEKAKRIYREIKELECEQQLELDKLRDMENTLQHSVSQQIIVHKTLYPNTQITINQVQENTAHTHSKCRVRIKDGELAYTDPD